MDELVWVILGWVTMIYGFGVVAKSFQESQKEENFQPVRITDQRPPEDPVDYVFQGQLVLARDLFSDGIWRKAEVVRVYDDTSGGIELFQPRRPKHNIRVGVYFPETGRATVGIRSTDLRMWS